MLDLNYGIINTFAKELKIKIFFVLLNCNICDFFKD